MTIIYIYILNTTLKIDIIIRTICFVWLNTCSKVISVVKAEGHFTSSNLICKQVATFPFETCVDVDGVLIHKERNHTHRTQSQTSE